MNKVLPYHSILFQHEALRSRQEIREYLLQTIVHEVYENIAQSLSLVRVYLTGSPSGDGNIQKASYIVGSSIKELKELCELFYRDIEADNSVGWIKMLDYTIQTLDAEDHEPIRIQGEPVQITTGLKLIIARMVQEVLIAIKKQKMKFIDTQVLFLNKKVKICIDFSGGRFRLSNINCRGALDVSLHCLNFTEKLQLIQAGIARKSVEKGVNRIIIEVSINTTPNE